MTHDEIAEKLEEIGRAYLDALEEHGSISMEAQFAAAEMKKRLITAYYALR